MNNILKFLVSLYLFFASCAYAVESTPAGSVWLNSSNLTTIDYRFKIEKDPGVGTSVFWAQQFWMGGANSGSGYLGLQRNPNGHPYKKSVIFSIWSATGATAGNMPYTVASTFGGEGTGYHLVTSFDWQVGHVYDFRLQRLSATVWDVTITDESTKKTYHLGSIKGLATWGNLSGYVANFTEVFWNNSNCAAIPNAKATFLPPVGNMGAVGINQRTLNARTYGSYSVCTPASRQGAVSGVNVGVRSILSGYNIVETIGLSQGPESYDFTMHTSSGSLLLNRGGQAVTQLTVNTLMGIRNVQFSVSGLPTGATASFSPMGATTLRVTLRATKTVPVGNYRMSIKATSGGYSHATNLTLTIR